MAPLEEGEENPMSSMTLGQFVPPNFFKKTKKTFIFYFLKNNNPRVDVNIIIII